MMQSLVVHSHLGPVAKPVWCLYCTYRVVAAALDPLCCFPSATAWLGPCLMVERT